MEQISLLGESDIIGYQLYVDDIIKEEKKYKFNYKGNAESLKVLNGKECFICANYLNQDYVGIKFNNGVETTATMNELILSN